MTYSSSPDLKNDLANALFDVFYKNEDWSYEKEWRIMIHNLKCIRVKPNKLYIGCNSSPETKELYKIICSFVDLEFELI